MIMAGRPLANVRAKAPLVHFLTNYVTVNDCANITLACGGSPIMADESKEVEQICSLCSALVLNIGTANERTLSSMLRAGRHANKLGIPVLLDPVGAGASDFRNEAVNLLLREVSFTAIKGNVSEIKFLSHGISSTQGADASAGDLVSEENLESSLRVTQKLSAMTGSLIAITGPIDIVADGRSGFALRNGDPMMPMVTGTGCMAGAVAGCFLGADPARPLEAMIAAIAAMGICGELARAKLNGTGGGNASLQRGMIDAMCGLTDEILMGRMNLQQVF